MGIGLSETSPQFLSSQYFGEILEQRTEGRITVNVFPNSQLGDDVQMMEMLQTGTLDMTYPSSSATTGYVQALSASDLPFLLPSREAAIAVMQSDVAQEMLDGFEGTGLKASLSLKTATASSLTARAPLKRQNMSQARMFAV
nr:TRAP transporter substrate-binding protein DctP [Halomonas lionensis]